MSLFFLFRSVFNGMRRLCNGFAVILNETDRNLTTIRNTSVIEMKCIQTRLLAR